MELPFIEEWIEHHLSLGVDKIYIYNNGDAPSDSDEYLQAGARELSRQEKNIKWAKKPDAEYCLELTSEEALKQLNKILEEYKGKVFLKSWIYGKDHSTAYPESQITGYKNCAENNYSDWWLFMDVDEFLFLNKHKNIKSFLSDQPDSNHSLRLEFPQRVFNKRVKEKSVRKIFDWGYDHLTQFKSMIKGIKFRDGNDICDVHSIGGECVESIAVPFEVARYHHYRGDPIKMGGPAHRRMGKVSFNKFDISMSKYFQKTGIITPIIGDAYDSQVRLGMISKNIYCKRNKYELIIPRKKEYEKIQDPNKRPGWVKVDCLIENYHKYNLLFLSDADVCIMNFDFNLEELAKEFTEEKLMLITKDRNGINSGNVLIKGGSQIMYYYLNRWRDLLGGQYKYVGYQDQPALSYMIHETDFKKHVKIVDQSLINSYPKNIAHKGDKAYKNGDFLIHYAGYNTSLEEEELNLSKAMEKDFHKSMEMNNVSCKEIIESKNY